MDTGSPFPPPQTPRQPAPRRRSRSLVTVAVVAAIASAGLAGAALIGWSDDETVLLEVTDAVVDAPPPTVAPLDTTPDAETAATAADDADAPDSSDSTNGVTAETDIGTAPVDPTGPARPPVTNGASIETDGGADEIELSPLAELLGPRFSTIPDDIEPRPRPVSVVSDRIDIDRFPVRAVGLEPDGQLEVPDETEIGWYQYGATAGRPGATVLAAHVSWNRTTGPFFRLGSKEPGDRLVVTLDDGTEREYEVTERTMYDKNELPRERIWRNTGPETLVLITCGGDFNPEIRRYRQNIVVYAVPVA